MTGQDKNMYWLMQLEGKLKFALWWWCLFAMLLDRGNKILCKLVPNIFAVVMTSFFEHFFFLVAVDNYVAHSDFVRCMTWNFVWFSLCRTIPFAWNLITAGYIEQSVPGVCIYSFKPCFCSVFILFWEIYLCLYGIHQLIQVTLYFYR